MSCGYKIQHEINFIYWGVAMTELSNGTKKHTSKSHETIPSKLKGPEYFNWGDSSYLFLNPNPVCLESYKSQKCLKLMMILKIPNWSQNL
jgi:hypothetical protein